MTDRVNATLEAMRANPARAYDEPAHPRQLLSDNEIRDLYAGQRYQNERRTVLDNTPFNRTLRQSPLASTMTDL